MKSQLKNFSSRKDHFAYILNITKAMLDAAKTEDWQKLTEMEPLRKQYLDEFFVSPVTAEESPWVKLGIERIMEIDKQLIAISEQAKRSMVNSRSNMTKGQNAAKAYTQPGR